MLVLDRLPHAKGSPLDATVMIASFYDSSKLWIDTVADSVVLYSLLKMIMQ